MLTLYLYNKLCNALVNYKSAEGSLEIMISIIFKYYIEMTLLYYEFVLYSALLFSPHVNLDEHEYLTIIDKLQSNDINFNDNENMIIAWSIIILIITILTKLYVFTNCIMSLYNRKIQCVE